MTVLKDILSEAKNLAAVFEKTGAEVVEPDFLQISNVLLDLYGEDIRGRAFITNDPVYGEMMLRPDYYSYCRATHGKQCVTSTLYVLW